MDMMNKSKDNLHHWLAITCGIVFLISSTLSYAQTATLVRNTDASLWTPPSPDSGGITYIETSGVLLVSDSEVNETPLFTGDNLYQASTGGTLLTTLTTMSYTNEPTGLTYNKFNGHLFVSTDNSPKRIFEVDPGSDGIYSTSDDIVTSFKTKLFGSSDAEGIAFNPTQGVLHIVDGINSEVYTIHPGNNGIFDGVPPEGDDSFSSFDTAIIGITDPEGIAYDTDFGHLYIVGQPKRTVAHVSIDGVLQRLIDISAANPNKPAGLVYAPSSHSDGTNSLYVVDRGVDNNADPNENDGRLSELTLPDFQANSPPSVAITAPENGSSFVSGDIVSLVGTAVDVEDGNLSSQLIWSSSMDGHLGQSDTVLISTLSIGTHVIEASVSDSASASASNTILLNVTETANVSPLVTISSPNSGDTYQTSDIIEFTGTANDSEDGDLSAELVWSSDRDGTIGIGSVVSTLSEGNHVISASVTDSAGLTGVSTVDVTVNATTDNEITLDFQVSSSNNDAEERSNLSVTLTSIDLQLVFAKPAEQVVGVKFDNVFIPQGSGIIESYIQFQSSEANATTTQLILQGEASNNASNFLNQSGNISSRPVTMASTNWTPPPWRTVGVAGQDQRTTDLRLPMQEIVARPGWTAGNSLAIIIRGTGKRVAESFDGNSAAAPRLHVVYSTANMPPLVDAGLNQNVLVNESVTLSGSIVDDGIPTIPGTVSSLWRLVSGPGNVVFDNSTSSVVAASFNSTGSYILELTADDGELQGLDQVKITVGPSTGNDAPIVDAGPDSSGAINTQINLAGFITDDGLPNPPGMIDAQWIKFSGPGNVVFADSTSEVTTASFSVPGLYTLQLTGYDGELKVSDQLSILISNVTGLVILDIPVVDSNDDAEERSTGKVSVTSSDLELVDDSVNQTIGLRFRNVSIPENTLISNAYIQFHVDEVSVDYAGLAIRGDYSGDALAFSTTPGDVTSRPKTSTVIDWIPGPWATVGNAGVEQRTPDLSNVIQEIIEKPDWTSGNSLVLIINGTGRRVAESFNGSAIGAPKLHLEYQSNN